MAVIGITSCREVEDYRQAILEVGGEPRVLSADAAPAEAMAAIDGLLLSGGEDVDPALFGEDRQAAVVRVNPERDAFEIALAREARTRGLPMLAICRGIQVLTVACGGTLVQDIPSKVGDGVRHRLPVPQHAAWELAHDVAIHPDSLLSRFLPPKGAQRCDVNSRHHQAVKRLAKGFRVAATAPDGVIEAIEDPAVTFCVGVQWHPESFWRTGEFRPLFAAFVNVVAPRKIPQ